MDDSFVETSDLEELAELGKHEKNLLPSTPRKRIKLFHVGERAISNSLSSLHHSSPLRDSQHVNRQMSNSSDEVSYEPSLLVKHTLVSPMQTSTAPAIGSSKSPSRQSLSSRSPSRTPPVTLSSFISPENAARCTPSYQSTNPLPQDLSRPVSPNSETRKDLDVELSLEENNRSQPSTTPPDTPNSAYQYFRWSDLLAFQGTLNVSSPASDQFLLFSPAKTSRTPPPTSSLMNTSHSSLVGTLEPIGGLNLPAEEKRSPLSARSRSGSPSSSPLARLHRAVTTVPVNDQIDTLPAEQQGLRYSFRKRNAAQLAPYTADLIQYKRALRFNPAAIVKMKQIERQLEKEQQYIHPDDHYEDEEFNNQLDALEDVEWEEREKRRRRRLEKMKETSSVQDFSHYPAILQDLSTDEEEKEMDATSKAARKILRTKEREQIAREKKEAKRQEDRSQITGQKATRPKPHPFSRPKHGSSSCRSPFLKTQFTAEPQLDGCSSREPTPPSPSFPSHIKEPPRAVEDVVVRNYFNDADFEMFDEPRTSYAESPPGSVDIVLEDDEHGEDVGGGSSDPSTLTGVDLNPKKKRILFKMMPRGMAEKLVREVANCNRTDRRSRSPVSGVEDDALLFPGQTRVRKATNPKGIQDIRGDSESEEDRRSPTSSSSSAMSISDESDSDSDSVEILRTYRPSTSRYKSVKPETIHVQTDSEGDEDIQFFVQKTQKRTKLPDQSLVNYMLPRVQSTGGSSRIRTSHSKRPASKYKYDIIAKGSRGVGRELQTLLSFNEHKLKKRRRDSGVEAIVPSSVTNRSRSSFARTRSPGNNDGPLGKEADSTGAHYDHVQNRKQPARKERLRKTRAKRNGIYNFISDGNTRITTGKRADAAFFTVDVEDEYFHYALAPTAGPMPRYEPPQPRNSKQFTARTGNFNAQQHGHNPSVQDDGQAVDVPKGNTKIITCDLGIKRICSGRSFGQSSYIRKGWLHELINVVSSGILDNTPPPSTLLSRFELNSTMGVCMLCATLPKIFDDLFEKATDILDTDSDTLGDEWKPGFRVASQIISWYLQNALDSEKTVIRETVNKEVSRIVSLMDKHSISFVEKPILSLCWFLVELSARVSIPLPTSYPELLPSLKVSSRMMMQLLLRIGIEKTADVIRSDVSLDEPVLIFYAMELWVCLIHLLGIPKEGTPKSKLNPFWTILMDALPSVVTKDSNYSLKVSEDVWLGTFTFSALSQFSVHGMATAEPRLPAYWDLVAYALKSICLSETEEEGRLQVPFMRKRDRYVALVVTRCEHLHKVWHWRLDEASSMFNQVSEIFRSRNFANLRFEDDKLPKFFKHTDWRLLESHDSTDTIFSIFLKLIMRADREEINVGRKSAKLKKLLSLAVPLRSLSFPTNRPPSGRELSMFYNRLSAIALALYLDSSDRSDRINKARHYVDFTTADIKTRHTILCGLERLCHLMIERDMKLGPMLDWIDDLAKVANAELKVFSSENPAPCRDKNLMGPAIQLVKHLLETVSRLVATFANASRFFDPLLFGKLKSILASSVLKTDTLREEFAQLLDVIFTARLKVLPKPARPFIPEEINEEESQNYFESFDDIDFTAIGDLPGNDHAADILEKDRVFRQDVDGKLKWVIYTHLRPYVVSPPSSAVSWKAYANECDKWLRRWLCFHDLQQSQENKWHDPIHLLYSITTQDKDNDDPWIHRVNLSIMFQLLQLDPMAYLTFMNRALRVFFRALVSDSLTLENEYVSCLLSIDCLRCSLFIGAGTVLPPRDATSGDYHFSADQFLELRLPLIRVIFRNIDRFLSNENMAEMEDRTSFVDYCHNMFSWMRRVRTQLLQRSGDMGDKAAQYTRFCLQILEAFQENPLLRTQHRLEFFLGWARTLQVAAPL